MRRKKISISIPYKITAKFGFDPVCDNGKDEVTFICPECMSRRGSPDKSGHLSVNVNTLKFHCFRCGYSGVINKNIEIDERRNYDENREKDIQETVKNINSLINPTNELSLKIPLNKVTTSEKATRYLLDRGFTYEQMEYYDLRVGNLENEFGRIVIPNKVEKLVYTDMYSARSYIGQTPKYHNPSNVKKSEIVFNLHRIKENTPIILVEGALTAIAAGYHAVASLGKTLSRSQAAQIAEKNPSIVFVNYDFGAERESKEACKLLSKFLPNTPIYEVLMDDDRDAADLSREEYTDKIKNAKQFNYLLEGLNELI